MRLFVAFPMILFGILAGAILFTPVAVQAETRYVTDQLDITLRAGASTRYKILRMLQTGTPLDVLGVDKSTHYVRVRTSDGTVGFVLEEQLQEEPAARTRIEEMESRLAELQQAPDALAAKLAKVQGAYSDLKDRFAAMEREKQQREQELATIRHASANVLEITNDRERLRTEVAELTRARANLEQENLDIKNQTNERWFLIGAGVLGGGVLIGLILPHVRFGRRKSSWGSL